MKEKLAKQIFTLCDMLEGGYTLPIKQLEDLLGIENEEEKKILDDLLKINFVEIGKIEYWNDGRIYII